MAIIYGFCLIVFLCTSVVLIRDKSNGTVADEPVRTVEAKSGSAFLYFYSDAHYTLNGLNISYRYG